MGEQLNLRLLAGPTLAEARAALREVLREGAICPCCDRVAKIYRRSISGAMLADLVTLAQREMEEPSSWVKIGVGGFRPESGDYSKLRWWGLIEQKPEVREDGSNRCGLWRITDLGIQFVRGQTFVRKYVYEYDGKLVEEEVNDPGQKLVWFKDVQHARFDFQEIQGHT